MRKILIVGPGGSGKSTLAAQLSKSLNIEVLNLDRFYWQSGWIETPKAEWRKTVERLLQRDEWIMDGNYSGTLEIRFAACDAVIFLDLPRLLCIWRVIKRRAMYRKKNRPDIAEGCHERFRLDFMLWIWNYSSRTKPKLVRLLETGSTEKQIVWLRSRSDVEGFLARG